MTKLIIVDDQDEAIGTKERDEVLSPDIYRVSALWVKNSQGAILLAQRKLTKEHDPGKWGPSVAGTVEDGETYELNILKEAAEELDLHGIRPVKSLKHRTRGPWNFFTQWYTLTIDKPASDFVIQEDEVEQVKWFTIKELAQALNEHPIEFLEGLEWAVRHL